MKALELTGQRFGRLLVIERANKNTAGNFRWKCRCDCSKETTCDGGNLRGGISKSCGCLRKDKPKTWAKPFGESSFNDLYSSYVKRAKKYNREFSLSEDEFRKLAQQNCYYCGLAPTQIHHPKSCNGYYLYNGVDRVNNTIGYVLSNCVSCCGNCNRAKRFQSHDEFIQWLNQVATFRGK